MSYLLAWLPRLLKPTCGGDDSGFTQPAARLMSPQRSVRLVFVGDVSAIANREAPEIDPELTAILSAADLVVANCESPVVSRTKYPLRTRLGQLHAMNTDFLLGVLAAMNVDADRLVLSLANNHALDQGAEGFAETRASLDGLGIRTLGTIDRPVVIASLDGVDVGLVGFTEWRNAPASVFDGRIVMTSRLARNGWQHVCDTPADIICAVPHWDWEFCHFPRETTRALARQLAAHGIGLIAGHHAHVVQPVERIDGTVVAYGLGDFLGTAFPRQRWPNRVSAMLAVDVSADPSSRGRIAAYEMVPFVRLREQRREHLVPAASLGGALKVRVGNRLDRVLG
jgi:poly-gamma-glutamate capsule biosynthesis protein CapA/YwtB (metallophosphatase superfamily)